LDSFTIGQKEPLPPQNIRVGSLSGAVQLLWEPNHLNDKDALSGVVIYRSDRLEGGYREIARVEGIRGYFADKDVKNETSYFYRMATVERGNRLSAKSVPFKASPSASEIPLSSGKRVRSFTESPVEIDSFEDWMIVGADLERSSLPTEGDKAGESVWQLAVKENSSSGIMMRGNGNDRNGSVEGTFYCRISPRPVRTIGEGYSSDQERDVDPSEGSDSLQTPIVISQIHTGKHAFVELHNRTDEDIVLCNWSLQGFQSESGTPGQWGDLQGALLALNVRIPAKGYYLIGVGAESLGREIRPDVMWPKAISRAGFQMEGASVALVRHNRPLSNEISEGALADLVGWGTARYFEGARPAPAPAESQSIIRRAKRNSTPASMNDGGMDALESNAFDSNENSRDFVIRERPLVRNADHTDRFTVTGIFLRDKGGVNFVEGNCYYLVWNPVRGGFQMGKAVGGARYEFVPRQILRVQESGWHRLRIAANGKVISFWIDDELIVRVVDDTHRIGRCGVGLRLAEKEREEGFSVLLKDIAIHGPN
jgi:hypothetical protein